MDTYTSGNGKTYCVGDVIERRKASVNGSTFPVGPTWTPDDLDESWRGRVTYVEVFVTRETVTRIADSRFSTEARPYFRQDACDVVAAWKLTKRVQPLTMKKTDSSSEDVEKRAPTASLNAAPAPAEAQPAVAQPAAVVPQVAAAQLPGQSALPLGRSDTAHRRRMPEERRAITHKFSIGGHEGYLTVGLYDDGTPGEIFLTMNKQGSVMSGIMDSLAISLSLALQYGVPLRDVINKFVHVRFEPSGYTSNPHIRIAKSIVDYVARWLGWKFLPADEHAALGINGIHHDEPKPENGSLEAIVQSELAANKVSSESTSPVVAPAAPVETQHVASQPSATAPNDLTTTFQRQTDAPPCDTCGALMVRNGACYKCLNCGSVSGCS